MQQISMYSDRVSPSGKTTKNSVLPHEQMCMVIAH